MEDEGAADVGELGVGAGGRLRLAGEKGAGEGVVLLAGDGVLGEGASALG